MSRRGLVLLLAALSGCATAPEVITREPQASAKVVAIDAKSFDGQRAELAITLEVENPGRDLRLFGFKYALLVESREFAEGTAGLYAELKGDHAKSQIVLPVYLAYTSLPRAALEEARRGRPVKLVARGTLQALGGLVGAPIEFAGDVSLPLHEHPLDDFDEVPEEAP